MSGRWDTPDGAGVGRSYGELYVEYAPAARGLALSMVPPDVADDIVAEAFARVLAAIRAGGGPETYRLIGRMVVNDLEAILSGRVPQEMQVAQPEYIRSRG